MKPDRKTRDEKKSETIEVRAPWSLKQRLMARAAREGRSVSEIVRDAAEDYLRRPVRPTATHALETAMTTVRKHPRPAFAAILGAAGVSALLAGAIPAGAAPDLRAAFERLDANGDGVISANEMAGKTDAQSDGSFTLGQGETGEPVVTSERYGDTVTVPASGDGIVGPLMLPTTNPEGEPRTLMVYGVQRPNPAAFTIGGPPAPLLAEFGTGDADGDGVLSFAEFEERYIAMRAKSFALLDADGNGFIDESEMTANPLGGPDGDQVAKALRGIDANGDGRLTRAEYEDAV